MPPEPPGYRSKESYHSLASCEGQSCHVAIPVAQDAILVARDGLKTASTFVSWPKILQWFQESMVKLYRD